MAAVDEAREAFDRRRWTEACELYRAAGALDPDDVERFATASFLIGDDAASADIWAQAHRAHLERADPERAALAACWIAFGFINAG
ncbi:MAG: DNA-binding response regulator, partial [Vicinamibacterales bacterium]